MSITETAPASRPRIDGDREAEIYDAVIRLLVDVGYDKLTFDAVATDVRASKATLYRKWATKGALVIDAVTSHLGRLLGVLPDTGSLRGDLLAGACEEGGLTSELPALIGALVPALHRDADLCDTFRARFLDPSLARGEAIFRRAQSRGEIGPDVDLVRLATILPALCIHETVVFGRGVGPAAVESIIDDIVLPACQATLR